MIIICIAAIFGIWYL